jgi:hypothetical protein
MAARGAVLPSRYMAKFKPARGKKPRATGPPQGAVSCVVLIVAGMLIVMLILYFAMRNPG